MLQQKKTEIKKWLSLKSIGLGESDLDYDGGNVVRLKLICISSKVIGQLLNNCSRVWGIGGYGKDYHSEYIF